MLLNMLINPNMMGITGGVSHDDFIKNAQHVGMQKNNGIKSESEKIQEHQISDSSSILLNDEIEETSDTNENKQTDSTSQTEKTDQSKSSAETKESKNSSSDSVKVDLSSTAPATGELDFNEGTTIGSNLLPDKKTNYESEDVVSQDQYPQNYQQSENVAPQGQYAQNYAYQDVAPQGQYPQNYAYQDVAPQGQYPQNYQQYQDVVPQGQYPQNYAYQDVVPQGQYQQNYAYQDVNPQGQYQQNYAYQDVNPQGQYQQNYGYQNVPLQGQYPQNYQQYQDVVPQGQYPQNYGYQDVSSQGQYQQNYGYQDVSSQGQYQQYYSNQDVSSQGQYLQNHGYQNITSQSKEIIEKFDKLIAEMDEEALVDSIPDKEVEKDFEEALINSIPDKEVEGEFNKLVAQMDEAEKEALDSELEELPAMNADEIKSAIGEMLPNQAKSVRPQSEEALVNSIPDKEVEKDFEEALVDSIPDKEVEKEFEEALINSIPDKEVEKDFEEALINSIPDKEVEKDFEEALVNSIPDKEVEKDFEEALINSIPDKEVEKDFEEALVNSIPDKEVEGEFNKLVAKMEDENIPVEEDLGLKYGDFIVPQQQEQQVEFPQIEDLDHEDDPFNRPPLLDAEDGEYEDEIQQEEENEPVEEDLGLKYGDFIVPPPQVHEGNDPNHIPVPSKVGPALGSEQNVQDIEIENNLEKKDNFAFGVENSDYEEEPFNRPPLLDGEDGEYEDEINIIPDKEVEKDFEELVVKKDEDSKKVETPKAQIEHKQHIVSDVEGGNSLFLNELRKNGLI